MYKITCNGKTMVGNNEDSWRLTSAVWFVPAKARNHGAVYVGYTEKHLPEGGMNDAGLVFDGFSMPNRKLNRAPDPDKPDFTTQLLMQIMEQCTTVEEVHAFMGKYNLHWLNGSPLFHGGMFMFVDRNGHYLVAQADTLMMGHDAAYLLANFNPATTVGRDALPKRYLRGEMLVSHGTDTSLAFCERLSNTMSENRAKAGDGTLYTCIYDTKERVVHLYFFHNFAQRRTFHLKKELGKGAHQYLFTQLFPNNKNYQRFVAYLTPVTHVGVKVGVCLVAALLLALSVYLSVKQKHATLVWVTVLFNVILALYLVQLLFHAGAFYFPSPYHEKGAWLFNALSYLPRAGWPVLVLPLVMMGKTHRKEGFYLWLLHAILYTSMWGAFMYWGL